MPISRTAQMWRSSCSSRAKRSRVLRSCNTAPSIRMCCRPSYLAVSRHARWIVVVVGRWRLLPLVTSRPVFALSAVYLIWSLAVAMSWISPALELAVPQFPKGLLYLINKPDLDPLRLLHFLALSICITNLVPAHWAAPRSSALLGAVRCGEISLEIYCVGVLLSLAAYTVLRTVSDGVLAQVIVSGTGIALLTVFATLLIGFAGLRAANKRL
ncbi:OpgC domain-containing protein (plasmid) [Bradyrhizobium sp. PMVTL-01]|uniref:OpgC domain-containing protein n=1 Tax=Bradyrhizobium sp. PMVTL-01 TaxID=3434999 RepID=UPI003F6EFE75